MARTSEVRKSTVGAGFFRLDIDGQQDRGAPWTLQKEISPALLDFIDQQDLEEVMEILNKDMEPHNLKLAPWATTLTLSLWLSAGVLLPSCAALAIFLFLQRGALGVIPIVVAIIFLATMGGIYVWARNVRNGCLAAMEATCERYSKVHSPLVFQLKTDTEGTGCASRTSHWIQVTANGKMTAPRQSEAGRKSVVRHNTLLASAAVPVVPAPTASGTSPTPEREKAKDATAAPKSALAVAGSPTNGKKRVSLPSFCPQCGKLTGGLDLCTACGRKLSLVEE